MDNKEHDGVVSIGFIWPRVGISNGLLRKLWEEPSASVIMGNLTLIVLMWRIGWAHNNARK